MGKTFYKFYYLSVRLLLLCLVRKVPEEEPPPRQRPPRAVIILRSFPSLPRCLFFPQQPPAASKKKACGDDVPFVIISHQSSETNEKRKTKIKPLSTSFLVFSLSTQQLEQHGDAEKNAEFRAAAQRTAGVWVGARSQLHMVVFCVLPLDIADGVACRTEREDVGVDVVGNAGSPVVCSLCVAGLAPVVAAVICAADAA